MFRLLLAFSLVFLLSVAACAPVKPWELQAMKYHANDEGYLLHEAQEGNGNAQFFLGLYYCENDSAESHGARAVKWWEEGAKSSDSVATFQSNQSLGYFYLSLFTDDMGDELVNYDPAKKRKDAHYCRAGFYSKANAARAAHYLKACASEPLGFGDECNLALGHLYLKEKNYAAAYFWYATVIYGEISGIILPADYKGPLLSAPHNGKRDAMQVDMNDHLRFARMAARHLTEKQIADIDARVRARFAARDNKMFPEPDLTMPEPKPLNE